MPRSVPGSIFFAPGCQRQWRETNRLYAISRRKPAVNLALQHRSTAIREESPALMEQSEGNAATVRDMVSDAKTPITRPLSNARGPHPGLRCDRLARARVRHPARNATIAGR